MQKNSISVSKSNWIIMKLEDEMRIPQNISKCQYVGNDVDGTEAIMTW